MGRHLILVLEEDIGKAIGQALHHRLKEKCSVICIDGISCGSGDFIVQNTELHLAHSLQNFLVYYTGRIGKLQCILFPRKMQ